LVTVSASVCGTCGGELPADARFCPSCGSPVAAALTPQERRFVTVLFADLSDSTRLTLQFDPERVRDILDAFYRAAAAELAALRGQAEKFIGDAVMAVFGLPQAHEDDALRAVRAGIGIRQRAERLGEVLGLGASGLEVRVGVQSGDVAAGIGATGQLLVTGPPVNAASRLQAAATPGEVLVGDVTRALTRDRVYFGPDRLVAAKGFDEPLAASPVTGLTNRSTRRTIPIVGRRSELSLIRDLFDRTVTTGRPHLLTLVGEAGIGKTRLVEEFAARLESPVRFISGQIQPPDWGPTFSAVTDMLHRVAGTDGSDDAATLAGLAAVVGPEWEGGRLSGQLASALSVSATPGRAESAYVADVQNGFVGLVGRLAADGPVVVAFDGVERAAEPLLDLIERLARARDGAQPVLVIAAGRPEPTWFAADGGWAKRVENFTVLQLAPLTAEQAIDLARQAAGGQLSTAEAARVGSWAGGNPFFIVEMTGALLDAPHPVVGEHLELPPTIQAVVGARLDGLSAPLRELTRRAAVFVHSFNLSELALVADPDERRLAALEEAEVLVCDTVAGRSWRFRHETLRDVAYGTLTKRERMRLHLAVADGLVAQGRRDPWVADHLERAALAARDVDPGDTSLLTRAVEALAGAGDRARRRMESRTAVHRYERALALAGASWPEADPAAAGRVYVGIGEARYWLGEYPSAVRALQTAEGLAERAGDAGTLARALTFRGDILLNTAADLPQAAEIFDRALAMADRSGDETVRGHALLFAGWVPWNRDEYQAANALWEEALQIARRHGDRWAEVRALSSLSVSLSEADDLVRAGALAREAMELAGELDDRFSRAVAGVQVGRSLLDGGHPDEALPYLDEALPVFDELSARWEYADALRSRGVALREMDRLEEAEADLTKALRVLEQLGETSLTRWTWQALARVSERRGDAVTAAHRREHAERAPSFADE
jgi:class 3 adenylate cyclase/tetratricopeptide (TPR) repeat protein